jgi:hypothetical protein
MEKVYKPVLEATKAGEAGSRGEKCDPNVTQEEQRELAQKANSLKEFKKA